MYGRSCLRRVFLTKRACLRHCLYIYAYVLATFSCACVCGGTRLFLCLLVFLCVSVFCLARKRVCVGVVCAYARTSLSHATPPTRGCRSPLWWVDEGFLRMRPATLTRPQQAEVRSRASRPGFGSGYPSAVKQRMRSRTETPQGGATPKTPQPQAAA